MLSTRSQYLNALNIPEYLHRAKKHANHRTKPISVKCLVVEGEAQESICSAGEAQIFLLKMLAAIGLQQTHIMCIKASADTLIQEVSNYDAAVILLTDERLALNTNNVFVIPHPSDILSNEPLKRKAWEVLKQVKICLV